MMDVLYAFAVFVLVFGALAVFWLTFDTSRLRDSVARRAQTIRDRFIGKAPPIEEALTLKREDKKSRLDALAARFLPNTDKWRREILKTGTSLTIARLVVFGLVAGATVTAGLFFMGISPFIVWPAGIGITLWSPKALVRNLVGKRATKFIAVFPDAVGLMVRGLKAGLPITETIIGVTREIGNPVGAEFRRIADQIQLGQPLETALWEASERIDLPEFNFMAIAFSVQRETGGNLAETLENLDNILRRRRQLHLKVRTFSAEARASATIIGSLPFVVMGVLALLDWDYVVILFNTESGHLYLSAAFVSLAIGVYAMLRLGKFEV